MGVRGELFSARVKSKNDRRTYFFNVKENRNNDVFVTVVESKKTGEGEVFDRHQVVVFEEDLRLFRKGLDTVLEYLDGRDPTYQDLTRLKFMNRCITETLRLWPVVGNGTFREASSLHFC